ncbi:hypothetical protein ALC62_10750 [Cyphomyrmex costatus]|uniref:Uncharacterized protein n=1 Tax=Cyphomyrmex costatus TaxID=456900 RepID=A0A151IDG6_9HYME|nr:hypothetical protein ALC62_10750 [Cyphomyrmex costatus]
MEETNRCQKSPRSWRRWNSWRIWPGGSAGVAAERCSISTFIRSKIEPVLLNDVNPTSFLAIRNTNRGVLRSNFSRRSFKF